MTEHVQVTKEQALVSLRRFYEHRRTEPNEAEFLRKYHIGYLISGNSVFDLLNLIKEGGAEILQSDHQTLEELAEEFANDELSTDESVSDMIATYMNAYDLIEVEQMQVIVG